MNRGDGRLPGGGASRSLLYLKELVPDIEERRVFFFPSGFLCRPAGPDEVARNETRPSHSCVARRHIHTEPLSPLHLRRHSPIAQTRQSDSLPSRPPSSSPVPSANAGGPPPVKPSRKTVGQEERFVVATKSFTRARRTEAEPLGLRRVPTIVVREGRPPRSLRRRPSRRKIHQG